MLKNMQHTGSTAKLLFSLPKTPFDYRFLMDFLKSYDAPRSKIARMIAQGEIDQVKKGLYVLATGYGGTPPQAGVLANLIYGPSYLSLQSALSHWGLIPEKVWEITSVTNKRPKRFETPFGTFSYKMISHKNFMEGVVISGRENESFLIASPERALCDLVAAVGLPKDNDFAGFLMDSLRIPGAELKSLNKRLIKKLAIDYSSVAVRRFNEWIMKYR